jgi:UDP-N-acetylglucosamine acyltransferase
VRAVPEESVVIHPAAVVAPGAQLQAGVRVGPFAVIEEGAEIGPGCEISSHVRIEGCVRMGARNRIHQGAVLGGPPQDLKYTGERSYLIIGAGNVIREYATLNAATGAEQATRIGDDCLLMAYTHIAHNCVLGDHIILGNCVHLAGHVTVEDWAILSGVVPVHQFVRIGTHSYIGGGSRVPQDMPPYLLGAGNPMEVQGINLVGLRRRGFSADSLQRLRECYRLLYRAGLNTSQALDRIEANLAGDPHVDYLLAFVRASERGITK